MEIMQNYFRPEFLGRLTEIVPFSPITEETVTRIFDIHLKGLLKLLEEQEIKLEISPEVKRQIAMMGYNPQYGARPVIGIIRKELRHPHYPERASPSVIETDHLRQDQVGRYG